MTRTTPLDIQQSSSIPFSTPFGIKELAESKGLRIANSVVHLLESLERGDEEYRLQALRGLRDEILNTAEGSLPKNTARVLLQIMKELVRAGGNYFQQLKLAHDFRTAAFGKPRLIRHYLKTYHLLEMPEEWNQVTFDDHVHDANTKGRKSPAHLIMDAWIKGICRLRVIYYHLPQGGKLPGHPRPLEHQRQPGASRKTQAVFLRTPGNNIQSPPQLQDHPEPLQPQG